MWKFPIGYRGNPTAVRISLHKLQFSGDDVLYQVSTIDALLQGVYDGVIPFGELGTHGDFGIGTVDGLEEKCWL